MNEKERQTLEKLLCSKNCRDICPDAVTRIFEQALSRHSSLKEADKAARDQLHQITGAFMDAAQLHAARKMLKQHAPLEKILLLHASTRERPNWQSVYERIFCVTGRPGHVLDLACGLNPLCLGAMGLSCTGMDIYAGAVNLVNEWVKNEQWPVSCMLVDLLGDVAFPQADTALMMKLLPVLERQRAGAGDLLLRQIRAKWKVVSFPTRTLGGRNVGMEDMYSAWMADHLPDGHRVADHFMTDNELFFVLEDLNG